MPISTPILILGWALVLALGAGLGGCSREDSGARGAAREAPPNPPAPPPSTPATARTPPSAAPLLAWLDPNAVSVAYINVPNTVRGDALAVVYGLPPRAEDLLQAITDVDAALDAVRPTDQPAADAWLSPQALVTIGRLSRRPTVLHPLTVPRAQGIEHLEALGLERQEIDAFEVWTPQRVFPYRVVLTDDGVAAFIPVSEPGSGLPPLAAARDMPPSDVETQLETLLKGPGAPVVALFAAGPMLHLDLADDVLAVRFELHRLPKGDGFDGQLALQIDGDPDAAAKAMAQRRAPEQSDRIQQLIERAAYQVDAGIVAGRLQLSSTDAELLFAR